MDIKTENLTILFVDIAGFTATTSQQSRAQNASLLATFNRTLLPLIARFKGRVVKSIGDALLITFRSPTDSMLCAMALQDGMHEYNLAMPEQQRIHIRVAASLGEVRVTKSDIFGEPVNVASRVEGITPADEIYLSEAVYLAMNKAEVPAQEVGFFELAGIPNKLRIYSIPRFATPRLVPEAPRPELGSELNYPYGGMHQKAPTGRPPITKRISLGAAVNPVLRSSPLGKRALPIGAGLCALLALFLVSRSGMFTKAPARSGEESRAAAPTATSLPHDAAPTVPPVANGTEAPIAALLSSPLPSTPDATPASVVGASVASAGETAPPANGSASAPMRVSPAAQPTLRPAGVPPAQSPGWNVLTAKAAYRAGRLSKPSYKAIVDRLEAEYDAKVERAKNDYRAKRISRSTYDARVQAAKHAYRGD